MLEHKLPFVIGAISASIAMSNNELYQLFAYCAIGGIASGYIGAKLAPVSGMSFISCWLVNLCLSVLGAPFLTLWISSKIDYPQPVIALAASVVVGTCGVLILKKKLKENGITLPHHRKPKNHRDGE